MNLKRMYARLLLTIIRSLFAHQLIRDTETKREYLAMIIALRGMAE